MIFKSVSELVIEFKLKNKGGCFCNGQETYKFESQNRIIIEWQKGPNRFKMYRGRQAFTDRWEPLVNLEKKLKEHAVVLEKEDIQSYKDTARRRS